MRSVERFLVTGALGCIGAWTIRRLLDQEAHVVGFDLATDLDRLRQLLTEAELETLPLIEGDITNLPALERALDKHEITNILHLAALQVPFCRDDPPLGAAVNVVGTANVFEAVRRRSERIPRVVFVSSAAAYGPHDPGDEDARTRPETHYGVTKVANEGMARIYWQDAGVASVGLRPYTVFGPTRDQGVTAAPSRAMAAAANGRPFHIPYGGAAVFHFARDVADAVIASSRAVTDGCRIYNLPGHDLTMGEVVEAIERIVPEAVGTITYADQPLPFPATLEANTFTAEIGGTPPTPLDEAVRLTVEHARHRPPTRR
jgi:nucleoside-diphosphate-sugar epimerase